MVLCGFVKDDITPQLLLEKIHKIEASLGRNRKNEVRNGPRSIDIDIENQLEILSKIDELEEIVNSSDRKTKKWDKAKAILAFLLDK